MPENERYRIPCLNRQNTMAAGIANMFCQPLPANECKKDYICVMKRGNYSPAVCSPGCHRQINLWVGCTAWPDGLGTVAFEMAQAKLPMFLALHNRWSSLLHKFTEERIVQK